MRLIIVRHGETDWNAQKKTQGIQDTQLNEHGLDQSERLAQRLSAWHFVSVFTSPLQRAAQTAGAIAARTQCPVVVEDALREIHFGQWEGMTFDEIGARYPDELKTWNDSPHTFMLPDGEGVEDIASRIDHLLTQWYAAYAGRTIVAVSHSVPAKLMVALSIGFPLGRLHSLRIDNASISIVDCYRERNVLRLLNDTSHLAKGIQPWRK